MSDNALWRCGARDRTLTHICIRRDDHKNEHRDKDGFRWGAPIAVGKYARLLTAPRVDCIGKVVRHYESQGRQWADISVPNWCADGWPMEFAAEWDELERSTATACRAAAAKR